MRITMTSVIGFGLGAILFIAASLMTRNIIQWIKPYVCAESTPYGLHGSFEQVL
jgi:hypothetical protein